MKVLIVEDELLVRMGLRATINWEEHGFALLDDAIDGVDALRRIQRDRPDIVLLDLHLPKLDGLSVLGEIREKGYGCRAIVITCNDSYQTVRDAMKLGAVDYLHKLSIKPAELIEVLRRVRQEALEKQSIFTGDGAAVSSDRALSQNLQSVVADELPPARVDPQLAAGTAMVVAVDQPRLHFQNVRVELFMDLIRQAVRSFGIPCCLYRAGPDTFHIALLSQSIPPGLAQKVKSQVLETTAVSVSIGVGPAWVHPNEIATAFSAARRVLHDRFYEGISLVRQYAERNSDALPLTTLSALLETEMAHALSENRFSDIADCAERFLERVRKERSFSPEAVRAVCIDFLNDVSKKLLPFSLYVSGKLEIVDTLSACQALDELLSACRRYLHSVVKSIDPAQFSTVSPIVHSAVAYIKSHLHQNLTLSQLAREVSVSESYLSTLFHREMGENCIAYINRNKVQVAKDMLRGDALIYEVADKLGFENSNYFSKVFKKYVGMSPEQYRGEMATKRQANGGA